MERETQRVMVVDDDADFVETIRPALEEAGYAVVAACNGAERVAACAVRTALPRPGGRGG